MTKRWRTPTARHDELLMQWGRMPKDVPDICYAWGPGCERADARLLHCMLASQKPDVRAHPLFSKMLPSLLEELEARGYDLTTFRLSIRKRQPATKDSQ